MARIAFIQRFWFEFMGTMYISALLKQHNHHVELFIEGGEDDIVGTLRAYNPDIIGIYCTTGEHRWACSMLLKLKKALSATAIMGGPHPTFFPEVIEQRGIDMICIGEGEYAMLELAEAIDNGGKIDNIRNLWVNTGNGVIKNPLRPLLHDLDILPLPDRELYYSRYPFLCKSPSKHFITGRGCPYNCTFCFNSRYRSLYKGLGKMTRHHSVDKAIAMITSTMKRYPLKQVRFDDEIFGLDQRWLFDFLDEYKNKVGLPYSCLIRANLIAEPIIVAMARSGCHVAYFGIESGDDHLRNEVLQKGISREQILSTARLLRKYGIKIGSFNMLGLPGETLEKAFETIKINQQANIDYPWSSIVQPYPRTELEDYCLKRGYLKENYTLDDFSSSYFSDSIIKNDDINALVNLQKLFYLPIRFPWLTGIIKRLVKLRRNIVFEGIFFLTYIYRYSRTYLIPLDRVLRHIFRVRRQY